LLQIADCRLQNNADPSTIYNLQSAIYNLQPAIRKRLQPALILCLTVVVLGIASWLPTPALAQVPVPPSVTGPTPIHSVIIAQTARKKVNWALWIGIGGGAVLLVVVVIAAAVMRKPPPAPQATSPDVIGGYKIQ